MLLGDKFPVRDKQLGAPAFVKRVYYYPSITYFIDSLTKPLLRLGIGDKLYPTILVAGNMYPYAIPDSSSNDTCQ